MATCTECGGEFKNLGAHMRVHKGGELLSSAPPSAPTRVRYVTTRAPQMTIVIRPDEWMMLTTPVGTKPFLQKGKRVSFIDGELFTEDPEVIEYIDKVYNDPMFPITKV